MPDFNGSDATRSSEQDPGGWATAWQQFYAMSQQNWNNFMTGFASNDAATAWWSQYMQGMLQAQQMVQQLNQRFLQASGLPTREDISRVGQQFYDVANRLDELEENLGSTLDHKQAENLALEERLARLEAEITRLKERLAQFDSETPAKPANSPHE